MLLKPGIPPLSAGTTRDSKRRDHLSKIKGFQSARDESRAGNIHVHPREFARRRTLHINPRDPPDHSNLSEQDNQTVAAGHFPSIKAG